MKKGIKNLRIYMASIGLFLMSCGATPNVSSMEATPTVKVEKEVKDTDGKTTLTYDDMILTLDEKGAEPLSEDVRNIIMNISGYNPLLFDFTWVKLLGIDDYYSLAYTNSNISNPIEKHYGREYYDSKNDSIYWDKLVDVIRKNSLSKARSEERSNNTKNYDDGKVEALNEKEIEIVLNQLAHFVEDVKENYPDYDIPHLACQLSTLALTYKTNPSNVKSNMLASTTAFEIQWYVNSDGEYPDFASSLALNEHEFKHFLCQYCCDEYISNQNCYAIPSGVIYNGNKSLKFTFIEEATAELYSTTRNKIDPVTYFEKIETLDNLRFVLSLQEDYEEDGFLKYSLLQNPLAMVQQFTVIDSQSYYFANILKMLACYNACLTSNSEFIEKVRMKEGYENFYNNLDQQKEVYSAMGNYAQVELARLFFTNLVIMNEHKNAMTLEYNFYLMRLFEKRAQLGYDVISDYNGITVSSANYHQAYQYKLGYFFRYLSSKYQIDYKSISSLYAEYSLEEGVEYPNFVDQSRRNFYQELETREYDGKQLRENASESMQYYIKYSPRY